MPSDKAAGMRAALRQTRGRRALSRRRVLDRGRGAGRRLRPPPAQQLIDGLGADERLVGYREPRGMQQERARLRSSHAAVERDQLLERASLLGDSVVKAVDED